MILSVDHVAAISQHVLLVANQLLLAIITGVKVANIKCMKAKLRSFNLSIVLCAILLLILGNLGKEMMKIDFMGNYINQFYYVCSLNRNCLLVYKYNNLSLM